MYINEKSIKQNFRLIMQEQDKIRKINHDRKYEFQYLLECMEKEEYQKGKDYIIEKYAQFKKEQMVRIWTGCNGIDNLLNNAGSLAKKKCVELMLETEIMESPIKEYDFLAVLGNLLDNAIEACDAVKEEENRFIRIYIDTLQNQLYISIMNGMEGTARRQGARFVSSKRGDRRQGFGLQQVDRIVEKYGGYLNRQTEEGAFATEIMLPLV